MTKISLLARTAAIAGIFAVAALPALADTTPPAQPATTAPAPGAKADIATDTGTKADTAGGKSAAEQTDKTAKPTKTGKAAGKTHVASLHHKHTASNKPAATKSDTVKQ